MSRDLHISRTGDGELLLTSRQDGMIRMLVADSTGAPTAPVIPGRLSSTLTSLRK